MTEINLSADSLVSALLTLPPDSHPAILDSCGRRLGDSRYLIAAFEPAEAGEIFCRDRSEADSALARLQEKLDFYSQRRKLQADENLEKFNGICVATFSYDFGLLFESLKSQFAGQKNGEPSLGYAFYETVFVHDYLENRTFVLGKNVDEAIKKIINGEPRISGNRIFASPQVVSNFSKKSYCRAVEQIRRHIARGDIYQANLTQQFTAELPEQLTPEQIFERLRASHPAPFAAFIRRERDAVVSASPERFLKISNLKSENSDARIVIAQPIKGTRPRGKNEPEDRRLSQELAESRKDRAENVMIVDLLRNDIGRVCRFGTVSAEKLCEIEEHPTLFHLVSTVRGELNKDVGLRDLLRAAFPCGSITGAPKIRAMQILDRIETAPRGLSMGALGYLSFNGEMDLNVAIRTMTVRDNQAIFNVGGGIVFDSRPEDEYQESLIKARALLAAIGAADF